MGDKQQHMNDQTHWKSIFTTQWYIISCIPVIVTQDTGKRTQLSWLGVPAWLIVLFFCHANTFIPSKETILSTRITNFLHIRQITRNVYLFIRKTASKERKEKSTWPKCNLLQQFDLCNSTPWSACKEHFLKVTDPWQHLFVHLIIHV